jgi:hypothetical protein
MRRGSGTSPVGMGVGRVFDSLCQRLVFSLKVNGIIASVSSKIKRKLCISYVRINYIPRWESIGGTKFENRAVL